MSALSPVGRYLREIALETVHRGQTTFTIDFMAFMDGRLGMSRPGFSFVDELQEFCWLSECLYWEVETKIGKCFSVRVPDFVFYEYQLDRLSEIVDAMQSY